MKVAVPELTAPAGMDALQPICVAPSKKFTEPVREPFPWFVTVAVKFTEAFRAEGLGPGRDVTDVVVGFTVRTSPLRLIVPDEFAASDGIVSVPEVIAPPVGRFCTWGAKSTCRVQD
jgi:hypothetical protein